MVVWSKLWRIFAAPQEERPSYEYEGIGQGVLSYFSTEQITTGNLRQTSINLSTWLPSRAMAGGNTPSISRVLGLNGTKRPGGDVSLAVICPAKPGMLTSS